MKMRRILPGALLATVLTASACTDGGQANDTAGLTGEPIKIGQIAPTGTSFYNTPDAIAVARAAVDGFNRRGGVDGRPLELVYCNDKGDPNEAMACARKLVSEGVVATVRSVVIAGGAQVSSVLSNSGIPEIGRAALEPAEFRAENAFLLDGGLTYPYAAGLKGLANSGKSKVFLSTSESANADSTLNNLQKTAESLGLEVVGKRKLPGDVADYSPFLVDIKQSGAEGVVAAFPQGNLVPLVRTAGQVRMDVDWILNGGGLTQGDLQALPSSQTERMLVGLNTIPYSAFPSSESGTEAEQDIVARFDGGDKDANPDTIFPNSWIAYEGVSVVAEATTGMTDIGPDALMTKLEETKDIPLALSVAWTPSRPGPSTYPRVSNPYVYLASVENGEFVLAAPDPVDVSAFIK